MLRNPFLSRKQSRWLVSVAVCGLWFAMQPPAQAQPPDPPQEPPAQIEPVTLEEAHELVGGPTLVTLNFDNAMPQAVYAELFRQAGISPRISPTDFWKQHTTPLTVHFERKPFWAAVRELETQSGLTLYFVHGNPDYALGTLEKSREDAPFLQGPRLISDSFLVIAGEISWSQSRTVNLSNRPAGDDPQEGVKGNDGALRTLTLYLLPDPKFGAPRVADVLLETAVDEKGHSLLPSALTAAAVAGADTLGTFPATARINLSRPGGMSREEDGPDASRKIARLNGKIRMVFVSASETWEVLDPLNSPGETRELFLPEGTERYSIGKLEALRRTFRTTYTVTREKPKRPLNTTFRGDPKSPRQLQRSDLLFKVLNDSLALMDANGTVHRAWGSSGGGSTYDWKYNISFYYPEGVENQVPAKLVWNIPLEWKIVEVPFEFTDLPLP